MTKFIHSDGIIIHEVIHDVEGEFAKVNNNIKLNKIYYEDTEQSRPYIKVYNNKYYLDEFIRDDL